MDEVLGWPGDSSIFLAFKVTSARCLRYPAKNLIEERKNALLPLIQRRTEPDDRLPVEQCSPLMQQGGLPVVPTLGLGIYEDRTVIFAD